MHKLYIQHPKRSLFLKGNGLLVSYTNESDSADLFFAQSFKLPSFMIRFFAKQIIIKGYHSYIYKNIEETLVIPEEVITFVNSEGFTTSNRLIFSFSDMAY